MENCVVCGMLSTRECAACQSPLCDDCAERGPDDRGYCWDCMDQLEQQPEPVEVHP